MSIQNILQLPFEQKCEQLTVFTDNCMLSTLESVFPIIISDIFGTDQPSFNGWNLCKLSHDIKSREFACAFNFLSPNGTIFKIIYTLLKDFYIKYRFPLEYLPVDIQKSLREGSTAQFYLDKLCIDPKTRKVLYLFLNPFEFYMFSFVKYLCDKGQFEESLEIQLNVDTLYQRLLAVYCDKFLPVTHNLPIEPNVSYTHSVSPALNTSSVISSPKNKSSSLFKPGVLSPTAQSPNTSFQSSPSFSPPHNVSWGANSSAAVAPSSNIGEVWRSELLVHLFVDFWLQYDDSLDMGFPKPFQPPSFSQLYRSTPNNNQTSMWTVPVFPSGYQVRCIRYIIKHFHQFSCERLQDASSLGELRRAVLPMTQARIYTFLRHHIAHWPLDSSFKLIQETWFSFIQPWRYAGLGASPQPPPSNVNPDDDSGTAASVDRAWAHFIADNLAAYTTLLHLVLDRFLRLDLNNLFNAHLVFRVAKVYSIPNLCSLIKEIEADLYNDKLGNKFGGSPARQSVLRLDQADRMFSHDTTIKISHLLQRIQASIAHCTRELQTPPPPSLSFFRSLQAELHELFFSPASPASCRLTKTDENTRTNLGHTIRYLTQASAWFQLIFNIPSLPPPISMDSSTTQTFSTCGAINTSQWNADRTLDNTLVTGGGHLNATGATGQETEDNSVFLPESSLTAKEMQQRIRHLKYDGDPDLLPPGSGEIAWLVKLLYHLSCRLNIALCDQIQEVYSRGSGLPSLLLHALLLPPGRVYRYQPLSHAPFQPKVAIHLPPRISLRPFASWSTLVALCLHTLLASALLRCNLSLGLFCVLLFWFVTVLLKYQIKRLTSSLSSRD